MKKISLLILVAAMTLVTLCISNCSDADEPHPHEYEDYDDKAFDQGYEYLLCNSDMTAALFNAPIDSPTYMNYHIPEKITKDGKDYVVKAIGVYMAVGQNPPASDYKILVYVPATVTYIYGFSSIIYNAYGFEVDTNNDTYCSVDGVIYTKDMKTLVALPPKKTGDFTVPGSVTKINMMACAHTDLNSVTVNSDIILGIAAFSNSNLETFNCKGSLQMDIGAFTWSKKLINVNITGSIKGAGDQCFYECTSLKEINYPNNTTEVFTSMFWRCSSLERVTLPDSVTSIGNSAFSATNLKYIKFSNNLTNIEKNAFYGYTFEDYNGKIISVDPKLLAGHTFVVTEKSHVLKAEASSCTYTFYDGYAELAKISYKQGSVPSLPVYPKSGYDFINWYTDQGLYYLYDSTIPVTNDMSLYAKYEKHVDPVEPSSMNGFIIIGIIIIILIALALLYVFKR
ncbi:MAG: leucine-rich repeat protein [Candidatus Methanomethylophilaceae archaeon]|nr:leucine-rich repeat protein [Candidatus Methanomethylophilaceae archaeon]